MTSFITYTKAKLDCKHNEAYKIHLVMEKEKEPMH